MNLRSMLRKLNKLNKSLIFKSCVLIILLFLTAEDEMAMAQTEISVTRGSQREVGSGRDAHVAVGPLVGGGEGYHMVWTENGDVYYRAFNAERNNFVSHRERVNDGGQYIAAREVDVDMVTIRDDPQPAVDVAVDNNGKAHVVMVSVDESDVMNNPKRIIYASASPGALGNAQTQIVTSEAKAVMKPQIVIDGSNNIIIVYQEGDGDFTEIKSFVSRNNGNTWTEVKLEWQSTEDNNHPDNEWEGEYPRLTISPQGRAYLITRSNDVDENGNQAQNDGGKGHNFNALVTSFNGTSWSLPPEFASNASRHSGHGPDLAVDGLGRMHVAWPNGSGQSGECKAEINHSVKQGGSWQHASRLYCENTSAPHLRIGVDEANVVYVMNGRRAQPSYVFYNGTNWSSAKDLFDAGQISNFFETESFSNGVVYVWGDGTIYMNTLNRTGGYNPPTPPDPTQRGFITHYGNKWGWSGTGKAFVPQLVTLGIPSYFYSSGSVDEEKIDKMIDKFIYDHGFNGFHMAIACRWFDINNDGVCRSSDSSPDQRTFDVLKSVIKKTYDAGGMVHLWMWGDSERGMNPKGAGWSLNGSQARAVMDKIASELGPLPGWTMGFGFDIDEWASISDVTTWRNYLKDRMSIPHLLGARPDGPNSGADHSSYINWNQPLDYSSYEHHKPSYDVYVAALNNVSGKPVMSEDRFRIRDEGRSKDYTSEETRRGLWKSTMAGGVANIWGNLLSSQAKETYISDFYPNQDEIKTYSRFFQKRFLKDMERCNNLTDGYGLCVPGSHYVFYKENTSSIKINLSNASNLQAIAVDTKQTYNEVPINLTAANQTWQAPRSSDWAIAVGDFGGVASSNQGDLDKDGDVDIFDYNTLVENFGRTACGNIADLDADCDVDIFDYNTLIENFGKSG